MLAALPVCVLDRKREIEVADPGVAPGVPGL